MTNWRENIAPPVAITYHARMGLELRIADSGRQHQGGVGDSLR